MLAIVIPYYKLTFFKLTLESLANQKDKRFKVYIGDDDSPENPRQLLKKYKNQFNYIYHKFEHNFGYKSLTQQWERCIKLIDDESWIMILGDDDVLDPYVVASFYKYYEEFKKSSHVIRYSSKVYYEESKSFSKIYKQPLLEDAYASFYRRIAEDNRSTLSEYIFRRSKYKEFGFCNYPLAWHADDRAWLDFSDNLPIYSINDAVVIIRMSCLHITGKTDNLIDKHKAQCSFFKFLSREKLNHFTKPQKKVILQKYESILFNNKPVINRDLLYLIALYLFSLRWKSIFRVIKLIFKSIV